MQSMVLLTVLAVVAVAVARPESGFYDSKYDNFNVKEVIENVRLLKAYTNCFQGKGKCTPEGTEFKKWMPEAVQSDCGKCTEKQKHMVAEVMISLMKQLPTEWDELLKEYNPNGDRNAALDNFLQKYGPK
ncbi:ejaculatory bulb-specific protein 3-like [Battus philenor]|uniref:ejaculatory bulb-specific protein 3-like n=1 Tax=Battus philenor TaxID=42288 RepID=UPI0035D128EB